MPSTSGRSQEQCETLLAARPPAREETEAPAAVSATSFLLRTLKD